MILSSACLFTAPCDNSCTCIGSTHQPLTGACSCMPLVAHGVCTETPTQRVSQAPEPRAAPARAPALGRLLQGLWLPARRGGGGGGGPVAAVNTAWYFTLAWANSSPLLCLPAIPPPLLQFFFSTLFANFNFNTTPVLSPPTHPRCALISSPSTSASPPQSFSLQPPRL